MSMLANAAVAVVVALETYFMILEMFLWTKPVGLRAFGLTADFARATKAMAANQGLYNGFLAAGLVWGLTLGPAGFAVRVFFTACVLVAGIFGGITVGRKVLWVQALPGAVALLSTCLARP